jgi:hypothetical protein
MIFLYKSTELAIYAVCTGRDRLDARYGTSLPGTTYTNSFAHLAAHPYYSQPFFSFSISL